MCFLTNLNALSFIPLAAVLHILKGEEEALQLTGGNMTTATLPILLLLLQGSLIINHEIKISQLLSLVSRESNCLSLESTRAPQPQKGLLLLSYCLQRTLFCSTFVRTDNPTFIFLVHKTKLTEALQQTRVDN